MKQSLRLICLMVLGLVTLIGVTAPAQASGKNQSYCNSGSSDAKLLVGNHTLVSPGTCVRASVRAVVEINGASYKVSYDGGSYSECRSNLYFDAWDSPNTLKFLQYKKSGCRH